MLSRNIVRLALPVLIAALLGLLPRDGRASGASTTNVQSGGPLAAWMTGNATPALANADFAKLAHVFEHIAQVAPRRAGFERWTPIAREGLAAAARHDVAGARRACKTCHDTMRAEYRKMDHVDR